KGLHTPAPHKRHLDCRGHRKEAVSPEVYVGGVAVENFRTPFPEQACAPEAVVCCWTFGPVTESSGVLSPCSCRRLLAKSKSKTILVKMVSQAGTGFSFNTKRSRLWEKLTLLHYDPVVKKKVLFVEQKKIRSL
uniref:Large ribosomal subunit protein bL33m n=1 Tax=Bos taurus TaxID=9913 RepID=A0A3Q1M5C7_BOVIN